MYARKSSMISATKIFQIKLGTGLAVQKHTKTCELNVKTPMSCWCATLAIFILPLMANGQIGVNLRYMFGKSDVLAAQNISQDGVHGAVEYHLRLKEKRLEFRPGLGYRFSPAGNTYDGHIQSFDFDLGTAIYPFDFGGDCDCPTFSKDGNLMKKGFFIELLPGAGYQILTRLRSDPDDPSKLPIRSKNFVWKMGGSAGLDIGISDRYTLTPILSATMLSTSQWEGLNADGSTGTLDDHVYFGTGLRLTYHEDDKRRRRRN